MSDELKFRPGVDMSVPQLFVMRMPPDTPYGILKDSENIVKNLLDGFHSGHQVLMIRGDEITFEAVGTATLEELGLQRIPDKGEDNGPE